MRADQAQRFQKNRAAAIPSRWLIPPKKLEEAQRSTRPLSLIPRFLSHHELQITGLGAAALARGIRTGAFSCLQVAEAFCRQAAVAQQLTNCLTEVFFTEALDRARQLDDMLTAAKGVPIGPLHGVPISVMDHIDVKGQHTTSGYVAYAETSVVKGADALLVETLRDAGAVLYCKTNTPQFMMVLETVNNIYGRTLNPWNTKLAAGGSGEGVLLALRGSPLGVGADLGGSIRAPAAFNGLYGFKPSAGRVSTSGWGSTLAGQESIAAVAGPLAHNVEDMDLFMQVLADSKPWLKEPLLNMPWRSQIGASEARTLTVGVMLWDEVVLPHPYITRVISEVAVKLGKAGHDGTLAFSGPRSRASVLTAVAVIPFRPLEHGRALDEILLPLSFTDGGLDIQHTLFEGNEPIFPAAKRLLEEVQIKGRTKDEIREVCRARLPPLALVWERL